MVFKAMKLIERKRGAEILGLNCGAFQQLKFEERRGKLLVLGEREEATARGRGSGVTLRGSLHSVQITQEIARRSV